jgi:membrane protein
MHFMYYRSFVFFNGLVRRMRQPRINRAASALALTTLLSLVPILTVLFYILSLFKIFDKWYEIIEEFIYTNYIPATGELVRVYIQELSNQSHSFTFMGVISFLIGIIFLFSTIETTLNDIWRVKKKRPLISRLLIYFTIMLIGPLLILSSLSITSYLVSLPILPGILVFEKLNTELLKILPLLFESITFFLIFISIPNKVVLVNHALIGALTTTILFELSKITFTLYIIKFNTYQVFYDALWAIPVFIIWIYLSWFIVLVGACVTAEIPGVKRAEK